MARVRGKAMAMAMAMAMTMAMARVRVRVDCELWQDHREMGRVGGGEAEHEDGGKRGACHRRLVSGTIVRSAIVRSN